MKYPSRNMTFKSIREGGFAYVDKTDLMYPLVNHYKGIFVSRPHGFGKSLLLSTIKCYFEGKKEYFKGLKIESMEKEWKQNNIFYIDFGVKNYINSYDLDITLYEYFKTWESKWGECPNRHYTLGERFAYILEQAHKKTGLKSVVLIDNYDKPILDVLDSGLMMESPDNEELIEDHNWNLLHDFYSFVKYIDKDKPFTYKYDNTDLEFFLITGNQRLYQLSPFDSSFICDLWYYGDETICGITRDELSSVFQEPINELADYMACTPEEVIEELSKHYGGYHFKEREDDYHSNFREDMVEMFNTSGILNAFRNMYIDDYWSYFKVPVYVKRLLSHSKKNLNELVGKYYESWEFLNFDVFEDDPLPLLYQNGYLTIKGYNEEDYTYLLDFPNEYAKRAFQALQSEVQGKTADTL